MVRDELSVLSAFLAVAEERSFTRAAKRMGVTQSALSHAIRGLEEQIGRPTARSDDPERRTDGSWRRAAGSSAAGARRYSGGAGPPFRSS